MDHLDITLQTMNIENCIQCGNSSISVDEVTHGCQCLDLVESLNGYKCYDKKGIMTAEEKAKNPIPEMVQTSQVNNNVLHTEGDKSRRLVKSEKSQFLKFLNDAYKKCSNNKSFKRELKGIADLIKRDESLCTGKYPIENHAIMSTQHQDDVVKGGNDASAVYLYPLHVLCAIGASPFIVRKCYRAYPAALSEKIQHSVGSPLHYACLFQAHHKGMSCEDSDSYLEVVQFLGTKNPALLVCTSNEQLRTPLHVACMCPCPDILQKTATSKGQNRSHSRRKSNEVENALIITGKSFDGDSVSTCSTMTSTSSSSFDNDKAKIRSMCRIEAIKSKDAVSLKMNANGNEVLAFLTKMFPKAVNKPDAYGYLPLHLACMNNNPSLDVVEHMIRLYPEGCLATSTDGSTPLHMIARQPVDSYDKLEITVKIIKILIRSGGQRTLKAVDKDGYIPLHICALGDSTRAFQQKLIKYMIKKYPGGLNAKDHSGRTPRDVAVYHGKDDEIIRMLSPFV